jgi:hypothetical protein
MTEFFGIVTVAMLILIISVAVLICGAGLALLVDRIFDWMSE